MDWNALRAEFPRAAVSWRAQSVSTKDPNNPKAMALAYIDARDVMERLDAVCGPANWSDAYHETAKGRLLCTLSLRVDGEWIAKSDGSGDSDIEGEKGAISGALKRAAVRWGIGRYLYDMPSPWVPCETFNGKWRKWKDDPWKYVRGAPKVESFHAPAPMNDPQLAEQCFDDTNAAAIIHDLSEATTLAQVKAYIATCRADHRKPLLRRPDVVKAANEAAARFQASEAA